MESDIGQSIRGKARWMEYTLHQRGYRRRPPPVNLDPDECWDHVDQEQRRDSNILERIAEVLTSGNKVNGMNKAQHTSTFDSLSFNSSKSPTSSTRDSGNTNSTLPDYRSLYDYPEARELKTLGLDPLNPFVDEIYDLAEAYSLTASSMSAVKTHSTQRQAKHRSSPLKGTITPNDMGHSSENSGKGDHSSSISSLRPTGSWSTEEDSTSDEDQDGNKVGEKRPTGIVRQNECPVCSGELATTVFDTSSRLRQSELDAFIPRGGGHFCLAKHDTSDSTNVLQAGPKLILPQKVPYECILVSCENCSRSKFGCLARDVLREGERTSYCGLTDQGKSAASKACKKSRELESQLTKLVRDLEVRRPDMFGKLKARQLDEDSHIGIFLESTREPLFTRSAEENIPKSKPQLLRKLREKLRPKVDDEKVLREDNMARQREETERCVTEAQDGTACKFLSPYISESRKAPTKEDFSHMTPLQRWKYHLFVDEPWEWDQIERSVMDFRNSLNSS